MKRSFTLIELLVVIVTIILVTTSSHVVSASEGDPLVAQNYQFTSKWGTAGFGPGQFTDLICITTDAAGLIYTAEDEGHRICKFTAEGKLLQVIGGEKEAPMLFGQIDGLAVDKDGNIYVGDPWENRVQKLSSAGKLLAQWSGLYGGIAVDRSGDIYVHRQCEVIKLNSRGNILKQWGKPGNQNGQFSGDFNRDLNDLAVDTLGNVYVCDAGNHRVQKFTSDGAFVASIGSRGTEDGEFLSPTGIGIDAVGNIYVADTGNGRVQKFTSEGRFVTKFGSTGSGDGQFKTPIDVAVDPMGNVYVADMGCRVQKFRPAGSPAPSLPTISIQPQDMEECLLTLDGRQVYKGTSPSSFASPTNVQWDLLFERAWSEGSIAVSPDAIYIANVAYNTDIMPAKTVDILTAQGIVVKNISLPEKLFGANSELSYGEIERDGYRVGARWVDWTSNPNVIVLELLIFQFGGHYGSVIASYDLKQDVLNVLSSECRGRSGTNWALPREFGTLQYFWPSVSPQGDTIVYRWGKDLCVADYPSMANVRVITKSIETVDQNGRCKLSPPIRWRPDGSCVAVIIAGDLYIISRDGSKWGHWRYNDHSGRAVWPSWSPDGSKLIWPDSRGRDVKVHVLELSDNLIPSIRCTYSIGESRDSSMDSGRARLMWVKLQKPGDQPGKLTVTSNPPGAKIYIEGRLTGEVTPHTFDLMPGNYRIKVQPQFGGLQEQAVIVESSKEKKLEFVF